MNRAVIICFLGIISGTPQHAFPSGDSTEGIAGGESHCGSSWTQAVYADPVQLAELSSECIDVGDAKRAIAFQILSQLRFRTDDQFRGRGDGSTRDPTLAEMEQQWALISAQVQEPTFNQPSELIDAWEAVQAIEPDWPPFYSPQYSLDASAEEYAQEFDFQLAAVGSSIKPYLALLQDPAWRRVASQMEFLAASAGSDASHARDELFGLYMEGREITKRILRRTAEEMKASGVAARVRAYGIFRPEGQTVVSEEERTPLGLLLTFDDFTHIETTTQIPIEWGKSFGVEVELAGVSPHLPLRFEWSAHHEPLPDAKGQPSTNSRQVDTVESSDGRVELAQYYTFVEDVPVACGPWKIDLLFYDQVVASQSFTVHGCKD